MIDYKMKAYELRYGGKEACTTCSIKKLDSYTCQYPEIDTGTTCSILVDAIIAITLQVEDSE